MISGSDHLFFTLKGESRILEKGFPALPRVSRSLVIPDNAQMNVQIIEIKQYEIRDVLIAPSKGNLKRDVDPESVPYTFDAAYKSDSWYPGRIAELGRPYIMRDKRGIVVTVTPFQYNPVRRVLRVTTGLTLSVTAKGSGKINVLQKNVRRPSRAFDKVFENNFINYSRLSSSGSLPEDGDMLVITYDNFNATVQPLVDWKNSQKIPTTLVNVSSIGNTAQKIKAYIQDLYDTSNLCYVLLVGDSGEVASPRKHGNSADPTYALLSGNDHYPDIFVGRFSAQTVSQAETQVKRTLEYEQSWHSGDWFWKGTGVASNLSGGHHGESDDEHMDYIRDDLLAYGYTEVDQIYDPWATATQVSYALNEGRGVVNYCGHGDMTSWSTSGFSTTNVDKLTNQGMLPFIITVACDNGRFEAGTCFAEAWLRATDSGEPTGAIAMYASSAKQAWVPPMDAQDEFIDLYVAESMHSYGGLCFAGACKMMDEYGQDGEDEFDNWIVFGDPSLYIGPTPQALAINLCDGIPDSIPPGASTQIIVEISDWLENYVPGTATLHYKSNHQDPFSDIPLVSLGNDLFEATLPVPAVGDEPEFYFSAQGDGGTTVTEPDNAPVELFKPNVGFMVTTMADNFEDDQGWTVQDTNLTTGSWVRVDPNGTYYFGSYPQPEDDNPAGTGTKCYVTGQGSVGGSAGEADVDGGPTRLFSPTLDIAEGGTISFYYYFYNSTGDDRLTTHISNDNGVNWVVVMQTSSDPGWNYFSFRVEDIVTPSSQIIVSFSTSDNPNNSITEAAIDDFVVESFVSAPSLWADGYSLSAATGGAITFTLDAGTANANSSYLLLGSQSGTSPGIQLPGGVTLFLNQDALTDFIRRHINSPCFQSFKGNLDNSGQNRAVLDTLGPITKPGLIGRTLSFAYVVGPPWSYGSTPVSIEIIP